VCIGKIKQLEHLSTRQTETKHGRNNFVFFSLIIISKTFLPTQYNLCNTIHKYTYMNMIYIYLYNITYLTMLQL